MSRNPPFKPESPLKRYHKRVTELAIADRPQLRDALDQDMIDFISAVVAVGVCCGDTAKTTADRIVLGFDRVMHLAALGLDPSRPTSAMIDGKGGFSDD